MLREAQLVLGTAVLSVTFAAQQPAGQQPATRPADNPEAANPEAANPEAANPAALVERLITPQSIAAPVRFLSDDLLEGRGVATRGDRLARLYLRTQLELLGLGGGSEDGSFEQPVPMLGITARVSQPLSVKSTRGEATLRAPEDYVALAGCASATTAWHDAAIVFVGYGIHAPEQSWDDFKGTDMNGKVLLVMNDDPDWDPTLFAGKTRLYYGRWSYKYEEAARRGAAGAIVIHTTPSAGYPFHVIQATHGREAFWLPFGKDEPTLQIRSWCSEDAARKIAALGGQDLDALRERARQRDFHPVPLDVTASLATNNEIRELRSANVLAKLPGSDPVLHDQVVVVTAHFDHLGIAAPDRKGDTIYNGALDNASGCAALLNLARACAALPHAPRRTLLFAAVTGEESGLLGSQYLALHPPVPRRALIADVNIDGIDIWGRTKDIEMIGYGKNSLTDLSREVAARRGRELVPDHQPDLGLFYRSDHFSFARIGVPAAYFKAGTQFLDDPQGRRRVQAMYTTVHYHQPSDEIDDRWNLEGAADDVRLILEVLLRTADADEAPRWTAGDEFEKLR